MIKSKIISNFSNILIIILLNLILQSCEVKTESEVCDEISCSAEALIEDGNKFMASTKFQDLSFADGNTQSGEKAHTGNFSVKLTKEKPFGMTYIIENFQPDEHFQASVWRLSENNNGVLVAQAEDVNKYYINQGEYSIKDNKGWELLMLDIIVPQNVKNEILKVYVWNPDTVVPAYFDDLKIRYFPQTQGLKE